ncbi:MAG TPA: IPT/TIG domain-containing protein, partial [Spirochaetales bacterium]|nr:IPT/TIG domain-containing protein [Spirochaetales bacterium]
MRAGFSPPRPKRRGGSTVIAVTAVALALAAIVVVPIARDRASRPVVSSIRPAIGDPGGVLTIEGDNFGPLRDEGRVEFDGTAPTASSYLSWSDDRIEVRVPLYADSSLVRVVTPSGRSNATMFMSRALLPTSPSGGGSTSLGPIIESLSSESGAIGSALTLKGRSRWGRNRRPH